MAERYRFYASGWRGTGDLQSQTLRRDLGAVVDLALRDLPGVEGGVWQSEAGPLAYGFPTYEGGGAKTDIPAAELDRIRAINQEAVRLDEARAQQFAGRSQTLLLRACPLPGPVGGLTAWTMTRVFSAAWAGSGSLRSGLLILFGCAAFAALLVTRIVTLWSRHVGAIEHALVSEGVDLPPLATTGERELDRIVTALNRAGQRLVEAREQSERLNRQVSAAERLASIGRLAAALAHEIRNPLAAMRLKAENALASGKHQPAALNAIIEQVDRLDRLVGQLLTVSSKERAQPVTVAMAPFLDGVVEPYRDLAQAKGLAISICAAAQEARFDPALTKRALENLLTNAIDHSPAGGGIRLDVRKDGGDVIITVANDGPGIAPDMADMVFEPFVSGRSDGTGLGLAIAREAVTSQSGTLRLASSERGAAFKIELPGEIDAEAAHH
jgi:signal transduction histidine kinase